MIKRFFLWHRLLLVLVCCFAAAPTLKAQQTGGGGGGGPVFGGSDQFDATGIKRYRLGPGDVLDIRVYGQPEFNGPLSIDDDGNIELPFVDKPIFAKCRTDREIRAEVTRQLRKYLKRPQVNVRVAERRSRPPAVVYGAVRSAQRVMMNRQVRLLELLAVAGGVTEQAGNEIQIFHTQPVLCPDAPEDEELEDEAEFRATQSDKFADGADELPSDASPEAIERDQRAKAFPTEAANKTVGEDRKDDRPVVAQKEKLTDASATEEQVDVVAQEEIQKYLGTFETYNIVDLKAGKREANPVIQPGDVVIVREASPIYITGAVYQPAAIALREDMSLRYAIAQAGGLRKDAKSGKIRIFRRIKGKLEPEVIKVDYNAIKNQKQPDVALEPYDVIDIPSSVIAPANLLNTLLGQGVGIATAVGGTLPLRMLY